MLLLCLLRQLLDNLLSNARKFSSRSPCMRIELGRLPPDAPTDPPGWGGAFFVRDRGVGFDMRQAQRICFAVTLVNSAPLLFLVAIAVWLLPSLLTMALAAIRCAVEALVYLFIFAHTGD